MQDEIFKAIELHKSGKAAFFAAVGDAPDDIARAMHDAFNAIEATRPTTLPGFAAKLRYLTSDDLPLDPETSAVLRMLSADCDGVAAA
jgi:hypothetical protein